MTYILRNKNVSINTFGDRKEDAIRFAEYMNAKHPEKNWCLEEI